MQEHAIKLHDIKPLMEIEDYSLYYFSGLIIVTLLVIFILIYFLLQWYKNKKRPNVRQTYFKTLQKLDTKDAKNAAYILTLYGAIFKNDTAEHLAIYEELIEKLEEYKYKKYVSDFDKEIEEKIKTYLEMIDV